MIFDHIDQAERFANLGPLFAKAFDFLRTQDLAALPLGKQLIDGDALFVMVQAYDSKDPQTGFWEAHRRYIDLQCVVKGRERIGFAPARQMREQSYDSVRDLAVLEGEGYFATLGAGDFMILWPEDAHMPGLRVGDEAEAVRKLVFKIAVD